MIKVFAASYDALVHRSYLVVILLLLALATGWLWLLAVITLLFGSIVLAIRFQVPGQV